MENNSTYKTLATNALLKPKVPRTKIEFEEIHANTRNF